MIRSTDLSYYYKITKKLQYLNEKAMIVAGLEAKTVGRRVILTVTEQILRESKAQLPETEVILASNPQWRCLTLVRFRGCLDKPCKVSRHNNYL